MTSYNIDAVANLTDARITEENKQGNTVYKFKNKEKKGYFFVAPAITQNFVQTFVGTAKGMEAVQDYVESLVKGVGKKRFDAGLHFSATDITVENLAEFALATSENVRLTKENIEAAFKEGWKNQIALALVLERDAAGAVVMLGDSQQANENYWDSEQGAKFLQIAQNYAQFILRGAERKPTFETAAIKDKVLQAIGYLDQGEQLVQKLAEKLKDAPIATVDDVAL